MREIVVSSDSKSTELTGKKKDDEGAAIDKPSKKSSKCKKTALFLILFLIVAMAIGGFFFVKVRQQSSTKTEQDMEQIKAGLQTIESQFSSQQKNIQQQQSLLLEIQQTYLPKGQQRYWALTNTDALVRMANYNLHFARNLPLAIQILQFADNEVAALNDSQLLSIRQKLADIITQLETLPRVDKESILVKLTSLSAQITSLPVTMTEERQFKHKPIEEKKMQKHWKNALDETWHQLQQIVVIQYHEQPAVPLLTPERRAFLDQQLSLLLNQAQWAFMQNDTKLYQQSLTLAVSWVKNNYTLKASQTQSFVDGLQKIAGVQLNTTYPDISSLIVLLDEAKRHAKAEERSENNRVEQNGATLPIEEEDSQGAAQ